MQSVRIMVEDIGCESDFFLGVDEEKILEGYSK